MADSQSKIDEDAPKTESVALVDDGQVMEVIVHRTDKLRANFLLQHPLVRIHVIDADTGQHVSKYNRSAICSILSVANSFAFTTRSF